MSIDRRQFLTVGGAVMASVALAPGMRLIELAQARSPDEAVTNLQRWGLLVDTTRCAEGCTACVTACNKENGLEQNVRLDIRPQWIRKVTLRDEQTGYVQTLPMMCQHCEEPPCADVCPTGASFRRADGIVLVDRHICIGCRYCMMACPYKARSFVHENLTDQRPEIPRGKGTVEACTMCVHRVDEGRIPACVEACNSDGGKAMAFGDMRDPASEIAKRLATQQSEEIRPDLALDTGVRYQGL
ncbi:MAG: sulfate reduction electron transfer complex DsrMKJOP subunit DsrO [Acidiferrobacterales bacterium]